MTYAAGELSDKLLANRVLPRVTEQDGNVSDRTLRTREIGAYSCLRGLMGEDWVAGSDYDRMHIREFLRRVVANAERQGIDLNPVAVAGAGARSNEPVYVEGVHDPLRQFAVSPPENL